ncbi:MAG: hypothetical protein JETT_2803 [Candidatus Jettenia ecosi]|uniref:Uncharacterized protein n=1 Tax=Candidatus Jettenia ecosi TaxID=2494326 RepID=A0A533Q8D1_9BACT|nr:MAG: hypothetical protein JETT_2803 [Candidatus Jettenia ecosi]
MRNMPKNNTMSMNTKPLRIDNLLDLCMFIFHNKASCFSPFFKGRSRGM